jgi:N-acetyl-gamma-glutamylphosphate reductase
VFWVVVQQTQQFNACIACATDDAYFYFIHNLNSLPDAAILDECDVIFFATPHGVAMKGAGAFIEKGIKVIDLGADFRLNACIACATDDAYFYFIHNLNC